MISPFLLSQANKARQRKLSKHENHVLIKRAQAGDLDCRNFLIENNIGLLMQEAFKRSPQKNQSDYFSEGVFGLIRCIELFDTNMDLEFSTYALIWIRQAMERYRANTRYLVRVPIFAENLSNIYEKIKLENHGADEEFWLGLAAKQSNKSIETIKAALKFTPHISSLDLENEEGDKVYQIESMILNSDELFKKIDHEIICRMMRYLEPREFIILEMRFENCTLAECARILKLSREGARLIQNHALIKLKAMANYARR